MTITPSNVGSTEPLAFNEDALRIPKHRALDKRKGSGTDGG